MTDPTLFQTIDPAAVSVARFHSLLLGAVSPRPIALASTVDSAGRVNLSPFSFFNAFSANPPILIFSPARRVRDNTTKHTLENVLEHPEVVINIVDYPMVEQMSLSSTEYDKGVNEFIKSGLTERASEQVKPPRVAEAPVAFECKVTQVIPLGQEGGAGNLVVCQVLLAHVRQGLLTENGQIDPFRLDAVARLGGDWYCRASGDSLFELPKPLANKGVGVDQIPEPIRYSQVLTGNNLGRLGNVAALPTPEEVAAFTHHPEVSAMRSHFPAEPLRRTEAIHRMARQWIEENRVMDAWKLLLMEE